MPAIRRRWTTTEVRALIDESRHWPRYELIGGELIVTPAPGTPHQLAVAELLVDLHAYLRNETVGVALSAPADLELQPDTITQPDVFVVPRGIATLPEDKVVTWADVSSLLLAIEVISPSSARTDRVEKRELYMEADVAEYWVVDVEARIVERWSKGRETPSVVRQTLEWHPTGAKIPLIVDFPALFDRIAAQLRIIRGR